MAYRIRPKQRYGFTYSGTLRCIGKLVVYGGDPENYECPSWAIHQDVSGGHAFFPWGFVEFGCSAAVGYGNGCDSQNEPNPGTEEPPYVSFNWQLCSAGSPSDVCTRVVGGTTKVPIACAEICNLSVPDFENPGNTITVKQYAPGSFDVELPFSFHLECDYETYLAIQAMEQGINRCNCHDFVDDHWVRNYCGEQWCDWLINGPDAGSITAQEGLIWLESDQDPTVYYSCSMGSDSQSGTYTKAGKYYNPGPMRAVIRGGGNIASSDGTVDGVITSIHFDRTGGSLATPSWEPADYYYTGTSVKRIAILGNGYELYDHNSDAVSGWSGAINPGYMTDMCGSYHNFYSCTPQYVDSLAVTGADLRTNETLPGNTNGYSSWESGTLDLEYQGWYELDLTGSAWFDGPNQYSNSQGSFCGIHDAAGGILPGHDAWGYMRQIGHAWVENPGALGQPDFGCTLGTPPLDEHTGCDHNKYRDSRMLAKLNEPGVVWNALNIALTGTSKLLFEFGGSTTSVASGISLSSSGMALNITGHTVGSDWIEYTLGDGTSWWGCRFLTFDGFSDNHDDSHGPAFELVIDGRRWKVSESNPTIDLLAPDNYSGAGTSDSLIGTSSPQNTTETTNVPWDLGIYKPTSIRLEKLNPAYTTITVRSLTWRKKSEADGGSMYVVVNQQAAWQGTGPGAHDPASDTFCTEYAGQSSRDFNAQVWYQVMGQVFVDGMLAGEIVNNRYVLTPNRDCGVGAGMTGSRWSYAFISNDDATWNVFPRDGSLLTVTNPAAPSGTGDNLVNYLDHGKSGGPGTTSVSLNAHIRLDRLFLPLSYDSYTLDLEKYYNGWAAVRVVAGDKSLTPRGLSVSSGVGGGSETRSYSLTTDKLGFAITGNLSQKWSANASCNLNDNLVTGSVPVRNRKLSILTLKGAEEQVPALRYCALDGKLKTNPNGTLSLECSC